MDSKPNGISNHSVPLNPNASSPPSGPPRRELLIVFAFTLLASVIAILWSWTHHAFLLYGDAEAHIHIARRLFDSHRPGITQLGSVWLPLPHLLLVPFVAIDPSWRSGFAPVIPSAACYLLACLALYRLARKWLSIPASCVGLTLFAANPNLLYLQTTAMTEPLFLAELLWSVLLLVEWHQILPTAPSSPESTQIRPSTRPLWTVTAVLIAAVFTRYDGWILATVAWLAMAICLYRHKQLFRPSFIAASFLLLLAPLSWMAYNQVVFGDWLDFLRGPYSARAIELRTATSATDLHPGWHNPWVALLFFLKSATLDAADQNWGQLILVSAAFGTIWACWRGLNTGYFNAEHEFVTPISSLRLPGSLLNHFATYAKSSLPFPIRLYSFLWTLLLWLPLPFYVYSVSYGSVPIFLPVWWPFSYYNTRYGMELLPALAFFSGLAAQSVQTSLSVRRPIWTNVAAILVLFALILNIESMLSQGPLTYLEARKNSAARDYYNAQLSQTLANLHQLDPRGIVLMDTSTYPSVVPLAGLTYRQTINESDKQFYWAALAAPAAHADIVVAFDGDEIANAVHNHPQHLRVYQTLQPQSQGWDQANATIYVTDSSPAATGR